MREESIIIDYRIYSYPPNQPFISIHFREDTQTKIQKHRDENSKLIDFPLLFPCVTAVLAFQQMFEESRRKVRF